jgi:hypothetical protein
LIVLRQDAPAVDVLLFSAKIELDLLELDAERPSLK